LEIQEKTEQEECSQVKECNKSPPARATRSRNECQDYTSRKKNCYFIKREVEAGQSGNES
jgi:hypothetical protein